MWAGKFIDKMRLRTYQKKLYTAVRDEFRAGKKRVCMQLPTGGGKTAIFVKMTESAYGLGNRTWIIVPRNELLQQASDDLSELNVPHGLIKPGHSESKAFRVHVVSKDTLIRRYDKIKQAPDLAVIDEAHLALDRYQEITEKLTAMNPGIRFIGVTATPERLDGRGLSEIYDSLVNGPSIQELIEMGYLSSMRYFCPPLAGLENLHRRGTDYKPDELADLLSRRKIYGSAIEHYRRHADGRPAIIYCRDLKATQETAYQFTSAGYNVEPIDGSMTGKRRHALITGLREGRINALTSCELITYGLDVPRVEVIIMLRPTLSRALYFQMIGRGLRVWPGKKECIILDHVNNLLQHGHPLSPYEWNFTGREKKIKKNHDKEVNLRLCPELDYMYCDRPSCRNCPHGLRGEGRKRRRKELETEDAQLKEIESPVKLNLRPVNERRQYVDKINNLVTRYQAGESGPVAELLAIAESLGRHPMWVYRRLCENSKMINVSLLHEIARIKGYKPGWVWFQKVKILRNAS